MAVKLYKRKTLEQKGLTEKPEFYEAIANGPTMNRMRSLDLSIRVPYIEMFLSGRLNADRNTIPFNYTFKLVPLVTGLLKTPDGQITRLVPDNRIMTITTSSVDIGTTGGSLAVAGSEYRLKVYNLDLESAVRFAPAEFTPIGEVPVTSAALPSGAIIPWPTSAAPTDWLLCDGSAVSRTTYADLFAEISTTFGAGDSSTTFNLPDLRGRLGLGTDNMGGSSANRVSSAQADFIGGIEGSETHVLTTAELPAHAHEMNDNAWYNSTADFRVNTGTALGMSRAGIVGGAQNTKNAGSGDAHENMPPYLSLAYIIKT